jgi:hypothetical protein
MIDFPANPTNGQQFTAGVTWTWDGTKWEAAGLSVAYLPLAGGTLTGPLTLATDPTTPLQAATKEYVDYIEASYPLGINRIINGDMRIDQRNNGASGTAAGYTIDRWNYNGTQASKVWWGRNINSGPTPAQFPYYLGIGSQATYTSLATDVFILQQFIEADMVSDFAWGSASAQPVTLSFWAYSSLTGTFGGSVSNKAGTRSYPFSYSIPTANTWTKIVVTIPGDTAGTWVMQGNAASVILTFDYGSGSAYRAAAGAWASGNYIGVTGSNSIFSVSGAILYLTGIKLEIGSVATPFNRQSLAKSQADCERYFRWLPFNMAFTAAAANNWHQAGLVFSQMRASPTIGTVVVDPNSAQANAANSANTYDRITPYSVNVNLVSSAAGNCYVLGYRASASAEL